MGVYIKGMEMPKSCGSCFVGNRTICSDGCPLVPVPPHRRLLKVLKTERECVSRDCNRDCGKCDLSLEQDEVLSAYDFLITLFADPAEDGET